MNEFIIKITTNNLTRKINRLGWYCHLSSKDKTALHSILENQCMSGAGYFVIKDGKMLGWGTKMPKCDLPVLELTGEEIPRIFFDMDGTVAEWNNDATQEEVFAPGYFRTRPVMVNVRETMKMLSQSGKCDVYVLSARDYSKDYTKEDKDAWIREELPFVEPGNVIYSRIGEDKMNQVPFPRRTDVLVDDYNVNLNNWWGTPIKMLNGINSPWEGYMVSSSMQPKKMAKIIYAMAQVG